MASARNRRSLRASIREASGWLYEGGRQARCGDFQGATAGRDVSAHLVFLLYLVAILGLVFLILLLNWALGPKPSWSALKQEPFECGATPVDTRNVKAVPVKYYALAIVFILFDLETVFLFIWALGAQPLSSFMLITFGFFIFLLVLILLYVYKARVLEGVTE
jgi:NADH-quinone oxidoreductase subunit A